MYCLSVTHVGLLSYLGNSRGTEKRDDIPNKMLQWVNIWHLIFERASVNLRCTEQKTAACSIMPSANLGLFSLKLPIIIMEVTNVLLGESFPTRSQENVDTLSSRGPLVGRVWRRSLYPILWTQELGRIERAGRGFIQREEEIIFKNSFNSSESDCI